MITRGAYSQHKFQSLSPGAQLKALNKLLAALDGELCAGRPVSELSLRVRECVGWMTPPLPNPAVRLDADLAAAASPHQVLEAIVRFQSSLGLNMRDSQLPPGRQDGPRFADQATLGRARQVVLILDNLRSAFNVGSLFRSAECLGLAEIWLCGVSATPDNPALAKTARNTADRVAWRWFDRTLEAVGEARSRGFSLCALETAPEAVSVFSAAWQLPLALVLGNESLGIAPEILENCDQIVSLPVQGWKNSLNVAVAGAICAYQIVFGGPEQGN